MRQAAVERICFLMVGITAIMMAGIAGAYLNLWIDRESLRAMVETEILTPDTAYALTNLTVTAGLLVGAIPAGLSLWGLWNAARLFFGYSKGAVFTDAAGHRLKRMGMALALLPVAQIAITAALSLIFTMDNPAGQRQLSITLNQTHLLVGIAGCMLIVIGWVMAEATRIADDNRQIV
ncbi:DUF2975 domain-containing protein [Pelagibius sp. CAU 1746]|uniref:DUF2975 domain-containing protein n=1 Tax=Pelagibius sp. CAU 1746 TaxID=3140370 RepID=UPI00325B79D6